MIIGIFGDCQASDKLVRAALNDTLEAHRVDAPDEEFWLCLGMHRNSPAIYRTIAQWAIANGTYVAYYTTMERPDMYRVLDVGSIKDFHRSDKYMIELVDRLISEGGGKVYALLGDKEPSVDVRRAIARATDNGLEVRDLAEAGLTYVGVSDNPLTIGSIIMANDLTLAEAGEAADNEDEESMLALTTLAADYGLDPDDFPTWAELAEALDPLMAEEAPAEAEPEEAPAPRRGKKESLSQEELEALSVPELRNLAKQLGVEGWDKNRSAKLIEGVLAAQGGDTAAADDEEEPDEDGFVTLEGVVGITAAMLAAGLRAFADAIDR